MIDLLEIKEHVPVAYRATLNAQVFRVVGNSIKAQGIFPTPSQIVNAVAMTAAIEDAEITGSTIALFTGVRTSGHTFDVAARGIVSENINFVAIKVQDESEQPLA